MKFTKDSLTISRFELELFKRAVGHESRRNLHGLWVEPAHPAAAPFA